MNALGSATPRRSCKMFRALSLKRYRVIPSESCAALARVPCYDARGNQPRMTGSTTGARIRVLRRATSTAGRRVATLGTKTKNGGETCIAT